MTKERNGKKIVHSAQIWTQNEPDRAHYWFPSYDFPDDKATSEQFITVETGETAIANGELRRNKRKRRRHKNFSFQNAGPTFDLFDLVRCRKIFKNERFLQKNSAWILCLSGQRIDRAAMLSAKPKK